MRTPLQADKTVSLTHTLRRGTAANSYTVILSGVSCHESDSVLPSSPGFSHSGGRSGATGICIFAGWSKAAPADAPEQAADAAGQFLTPGAFKAADEAVRAAGWTLALEDKVLLPSGRTGTVTSIQDNRSGRCPHWYVEVS